MPGRKRPVIREIYRDRHVVLASPNLSVIVRILAHSPVNVERVTRRASHGGAVIDGNPAAALLRRPARASSIRPGSTVSASARTRRHLMVMAGLSCRTPSFMPTSKTCRNVVRVAREPGGVAARSLAARLFRNLAEVGGQRPRPSLLQNEPRFLRAASPLWRPLCTTWLQVDVSLLGRRRSRCLRRSSVSRTCATR
jgi:hypothetical protein